MKKLVLSLLLTFSFNVLAVDVFPAPPGTIITFSGPSCPRGSILGTGSLVNKADYPNLFKLYGNMYGTQTTLQFRLPNYQGYFLRGYDASASVDVDASSRTAHASGASSGVVVGSIQQDGFRSHTHTQNAHSHTSPGSTALSYNTGGNSVAYAGGPATVTIVNGATATNNNTGGNETRPKNISVLYCIKF